MKRLVVLAALVAVVLLFAWPVAADEPTCLELSSGQVRYPAGHFFLSTPDPSDDFVGYGYDAYGFNFAAHRFSGWSLNANVGFWGLPPYEGDVAKFFGQMGLPPYTGSCDSYIAAYPEMIDMFGPCGVDGTFWSLTGLKMDIKWNDAYRSTVDCDQEDEYLFARHLGFDTYEGSGAWYTNHVSGTYFGEPAKSFSKVVAVPDDAVLDGSIWYTADGQLIGYDAGEGGMAVTLDLVPGEGFYFKGMPGLGRW